MAPTTCSPRLVLGGGVALMRWRTGEGGAMLMALSELH
jgi:hypothetical protein